jgi:hypothetical protein
MQTSHGQIPRSRIPLVPHEALDAYWYAQMLCVRALAVAAGAKCKSTIGRRLDSALGRVVRLLVEAADGSPDRADARLQRSRAAIGLALCHFDDLALKRHVRDVVIADLRDRAALLLERLRMLEGQAPETWAASNCLPTVLGDPDQSGKDRGTDVVALLEKVAAAATEGLPELFVPEDLVRQNGSPRQDARFFSPVGPQGGLSEVVSAM